MKVASSTTTAGHGVRHSPRAPVCAVVSRTTRLARSIGRLLRLMRTGVARRRRTARQRCQLAQLSDQQLRDAGIDPALAGRGKAIAVDMAAHLRLQSLGFG